MKVFFNGTIMPSKEVPIYLKGEKGDNGSLIHVGDGSVPSASYGLIHDVYIQDAETGNVWVKDSNTEWRLVGSIKGMDGEPGSQGLPGENGSYFHLGNGNDPDYDLGKDGDWYLKDATSGQLFKKTLGVWELVGLIKGEKGDPGDQGPICPKGDTGDQGLQCIQFFFF